MNHNHQDLHVAYNAYVTYHNTLVHMRFTVAALYLAATGFLVGVLFSHDSWQWKKISVTFLGLFFTFIAFILELRNINLLKNLIKKGQIIESKFRLNNAVGFFNLMESQPIQPKYLFSNEFIKKYKEKYPNIFEYKIFKYMLTHTFGLKSIVTHRLALILLYIGLAIFWILILRMYK